jgi:hypothetical protein
MESRPLSILCFVAASIFFAAAIVIGAIAMASGQFWLFGVTLAAAVVGGALFFVGEEIWPYPPLKYRQRAN